MTNSTTAKGWMEKSNFNKYSDSPIQMTTCIDVARHYSQLFIDTDVKGYIQWFAGKQNNVANALSQDWHRSDSKLTSIFRFHFPKQMPKYFKISPLPNKISSWLISLLQQLPMREQAAHNNKARAWGRWEKYCRSIGCSNFYMDGLGTQEKILKLGAFAMAVRSGWFSGVHYGTLAEGTVRGTISHVVQAFWAKGRQNQQRMMIMNLEPFYQDKPIRACHWRSDVSLIIYFGYAGHWGGWRVLD